VTYTLLQVDFINLFKVCTVKDKQTSSPAVAETKPIARRVWNSPAACWRCLFQAWKFWRFTC